MPPRLMGQWTNSNIHRTVTDRSFLRANMSNCPFNPKKKNPYCLMKSSQNVFFNQIDIVWNSVKKFHENCASHFWAVCQSMCISVVLPSGGYHFVAGGAQTRLLSIRKNEKITRTVPILNQIPHNFHLIFFMMDIKIFMMWFSILMKNHTFGC